MINTTNRKTIRNTRRTYRPMAPWSFGLHRRIAAAATVGAVCVFSLQMRHRSDDGLGRIDRNGAAGLGCSQLGACSQLRDAERREESP